jgi:hypothetical protein
VSLHDRLQALADADVSAWPTMPARLLYVLTPEVDVEVAAGVADIESNRPLESGAVPDRERDEAGSSRPRRCGW